MDRAVGNVRNHGPELIEPIGEITGGDEKGNGGIIANTSPALRELGHILEEHVAPKL